MTEPFEHYRPLLFSIGYRMLGSVVEAEDAVQDVYLQYQKHAPESINSHRSFLSTIMVRQCIKRLESARMQRESYVGPWLPEPLNRDEAAPLPERHLELEESISMAFLVILETLSPLERAVYLLRSVFDYDYPEIADILEREEATCRKLYSRAKQHVSANRPRFKPDPAKHQAMLEQFSVAVRDGDLAGLLNMLTEDVQFAADGGGKVRGAAIYELHGRKSVAAFALASLRLTPDGYTFATQTLNSAPAILMMHQGKVTLVLTIDLSQDNKITTIRVLANPEKLDHLGDGLL